MNVVSLAARCGVALFTVAVATPADALEFQLGQVRTELILEAGVEGAVYEDPRTARAGDGGRGTFAARLDLEWIADNGWTLGFRGEIDDGGRSSEELARDELYVYLAADFGRFELGEQDGPADVMSFHAPVIALGQVRGDFAQYVGSVASLSAADTADAAKLVYLSPPVGGLRFGASYSPDFELNENDPDPRRRVVQRDVVELGAQYQLPLPADWTLGLSGAQVRGNAAPETTRRDLSAWSVGLELRRDALMFGGAWVDNGDSSDLVANDEREWNVGVAWRRERWGVAASYAQVRSRLLDNRLLGVGGFVTIGRHVTLRADAVRIDERRPSSAGDGYALLFEAVFRL